MPGTMPVHAEDSTACQKMCANTTGCVHFSFWWIGKHCHLQDAYAIRQPGRLGFIAGPHGCWDSLDKKSYIKKDDRTFVRKSFKCAELGTLYSPLMGLVKHFPKQDSTGIEAVKKCRAYCASTAGCAHYTMVFPQRLCRMAGATAYKVKPYMNAVSGSPLCWAGEEHDHRLTEEEAAELASTASTDDAEAEEEHTMIMKASLPRGVPAAWRPAPLAGAAGLLLAGAAVASGAVAVARRTFRGARARPVPPSYATVEAGVADPILSPAAVE